MNAQIPLSFPVRESYDADNFLVLPCNKEAMSWVQSFPDWPYPAVIVYGEAGCGKTHLLSVWQKKAGEGAGHQAIDDVDVYFGDEEKERELFHLFNQAKENLTYILFSMSNISALEQVKLPDLKSRLKAAPKVEIRPPYDMDMQAILVKLFHDRQLKVEPGVVAYILPRIERSFTAIRDLVDKIDEASLAQKRSVTVPLVRELLAEPELFDEG